MAKFITWLRKLSTSVIPVVAMGIIMLVSLWLLSAATENSGQFGRLHIVLVAINIIGLIVLIGLIGINAVRLVRQHRRAATGSRLTVRLVTIFVVMALVPVTIVFYFSLGFLQRGIDSWFDVGIEQAMDNSLKLSRSSLDMRMREVLKQTRTMAKNLKEMPNTMVVFNLNELYHNIDATELTLLSQSGKVIASASSSLSSTEIIPYKPDDFVLSQVKDTNSYVGLMPIDELGLHIRVAVRVDQDEAVVDPRVLFALYPIDERVSTLADNVQSAYSKYQELVYLREPLKQSFSFTLALVLLVTLLSAVWAAFFFAQRLAAPIRILAIGTRAVASGNYQKKLPVTSDDDLGSLVQSFVDMTEKISVAQNDVKHSQQQAKREQAYLRAILGRLSSGVITLDRHLTIRAVNAAASQILEVNIDVAMGSSLDQLQKEAPEIQPFVKSIVTHLEKSTDDWREEALIVGTTGPKTLMCQGAQLPGVEGMPAGFVIVFDDVTAMIQAQRDAAWGEVAQRLAHEIKNPLTPIQLSAERLRHKYLDKMPAEDAKVLDRSTHTIIQQVQAMKKMVQAFSEYARTPKLQFQPLALQTIINEVLDLYAGEAQQVEITFYKKEYNEDFSKQAIFSVEADPGRMRQLLHNLIRNAIESQAGQEDGQVDIYLNNVVIGLEDFVELRIEDNGPGIHEEMLDKIFEPYATTKSKGGGLGLAVVKRIVEEHSGILYAENKKQGGTCMIVQLPAITAEIRNIELHKMHSGGAL